jgi:RNA polymerase sigma-70 factor (ECF subfamily)
VADQTRLFESTVLPHLDAAYNLARWILRDESDAHDVVQESAMRALKYLPTLRGGDALPWLLQIVRNSAFTWIKGRSRQNALEPLTEDLTIADDSTPDPSAILSDQLDAQSLMSAVNALPAEFREAIILREIEGMSYKQIAQVTGVSIGTVMSRISRARKRLHAALLPVSRQELDHGM